MQNSSPFFFLFRALKNVSCSHISIGLSSWQPPLVWYIVFFFFIPPSSPSPPSSSSFSSSIFFPAHTRLDRQERARTKLREKGERYTATALVAVAGGLQKNMLLPFYIHICIVWMHPPLYLSPSQTFFIPGSFSLLLFL